MKAWPDSLMATAARACGCWGEFRAVLICLHCLISEPDLYHGIASELGRPMEPWDHTFDWRDKNKPENERRVLTREQYYRQWRTWRMSDHMPLWAELKIDFTNRYLERTKDWKPDTR